MCHLSRSELARLVDEEPGGRERAHLGECVECTEELAALREQTHALANLGPLPVPAGVDARVLRGLTRALDADAQQPRRSPALPMGRIAAAIALFVAGAGVGTLGIAPALEAPAMSGNTAEAPLPVRVDDAEAALEVAEAEYLLALSAYAELSGEEIGFDPVSRLAALEGIVLTTRAALREAPADPVINNYHLTAVGHREALLRRIERQGSADTWF